MPCEPLDGDVPHDMHRVKCPQTTFGVPACVARPVSKKEIASQAKAKEAMEKEWKRLWDKKVWDAASVREWSDVAAEARRSKVDVRMGRLFGIMVEKAAELPEGGPRRKSKYHVVFQGNQVVTQNWEAAIFQNLGSSPPNMEAGKAVG